MCAQPYATPVLVAGLTVAFLSSATSAGLYDLRTVDGMEAFAGSATAKDILARNGFVVADPVFKQIFEPYIKSPQIEEPSDTNPGGRSLPSFITPDSAWHTYHLLLEEGVKELEQLQSRKLLSFSRRLWALAKDPKTGARDVDLTLFASVGLALQDDAHRRSLAPQEQQIVDALIKGSTAVKVPIGFPLAPVQFRAQSFYRQSRDLSAYFAARQWYASVIFRLSNPRETKLALALTFLVANDTELRTLWQQLSAPFDTFLASADDGSVTQYVAAAGTLLGTNSPSSPTEGEITEVQAYLQRQLPLPRVSDQLLSAEQYAQFPTETRGFRLLPPRRLPCSVCFQNTVDPKIPKRLYPSGLDFIAASPALRSPAATRAVEAQFGKSVADLILKADCGPMPNSLHGQALQLLGTLQKPLPPEAPRAMRNDAWSDLQLWTQLGAWAEQRHTWALHSKLAVMVMGAVSPPKGMVAPYPEFFAGLAGLARKTAAAFEQAGLEPQFDVKTVATNLLESLSLSQAASRMRDEKEMEKVSGQLEQFSQFQTQYFDKHRARLEQAGPRNAYQQVENELRELATHCAATGQANETQAETLRLFFDCRQNIPRMLNDFAPFCERLAELAKKSLTGQALTEDDGKWIENYGIALAGFHFYYGNSYEVPRDDFPIVTRVFSNPLADSMLYAGVARPQALYVIVPNGNVKQLYRGAVMTYREFVRPNELLLDDESWRELVSTGRAPPPPPFTRSFCAETTVSELLKKLRSAGQSEETDLGDLEDILWQISSRATEKDIPALLELLVQTKDEDRADVVEGIADIIARLPIDSHRKQLVELLASNNPLTADAAARILTERPAELKPAVFISGFRQQPIRARRLYCAILSRLPQQTDATRTFFLNALHDRADGVRWQAALATGKAGWNDAQLETGLTETLNDPNELVAAAAACSLGRLGATNAAPALLAKLTKCLQATNSSSAETERRASAITQDIRADANRGSAFQLLDPDGFELRIGRHAPARAKQTASLRLPPQPFSLPTHDYSLADALIESLGQLRHSPAADQLFKLRGTAYDSEAIRSLNQLAPQRLYAELLAAAKDQALDSYLRERALVDLANLSATNVLRDLVPLLEDATPITYSRSLPGPPWRICDRTASTIASLLGWQDAHSLRYLSASRREELLNRARAWAKSGP